MSTLKAFMKDEIIVKEGDKSKEFFILVEGKVGVFKGDKKLTEFDKEGTILGELSMILNKPRTASMKALSPVNVLVIEGELDEIIRRYPEYSKKLIHSLAERLAEASRQL